jgi:indole-3-glycerol phosphate synthase
MILDMIVKEKKKEVASLKAAQPVSLLKGMIRDLPAPCDFGGALGGRPCSIIGEVKRSSPSKGRIREDFNPLEMAALYEKNGAAAISVLTDMVFFEGHSTHLSGIREIVNLPLLRKDFIIDPYQIYESRILGADAVLLIAALHDEEQLRERICLTESLGLSPFVEVHTRSELDQALTAGAKIIGINNRDLRTFSTDLRTTLDLASSVTDDRIVVSESGINTRDDIETLMREGIRAFLIGETLMRARDIGAKLRELLGEGE